MRMSCWNIVLLSAFIACCGIFAHTQILQRAQSRLSPDQLAALVAQNQGSWVQFLLPISPVFVAYLLLPLFPDHQALLAVPAMILAAGLIALQFASAAKRARALNLPVAFIAARRKETAALLGGLIVGMCIVAFAMQL